MAMVDFGCRITLPRYSARRRLVPVKDASPPTESGDGLLEDDLRTKPAGPVSARTPSSSDAGRRFNQGP